MTRRASTEPRDSRIDGGEREELELKRAFADAVRRGEGEGGGERVRVYARRETLRRSGTVGGLGSWSKGGGRGGSRSVSKQSGHLVELSREPTAEQ